MLKIRPFAAGHEADYEARSALINAVWPDTFTTAAYIRYRWQNRDPDYLEQWLMVELDGRLVAIGQYREDAWSHQPGKYHLDVTVHPDYERRGIGSAVYDYIVQELAGRNLKPRVLTAGTREDKPQAIRFLEKRGFAPVMRWPGSRLDVTAFNATPFLPGVEQVQVQGIQLLSLSAVQAIDPDWQRHVYELDVESSRDEPSPDPVTIPPLEQYVKDILDDPNLMPEGWFVALDNGRYVGMTQLYCYPASTVHWHAGYSGVLPTHRRRGIMTALKVLSIEAARQRGVQTIKTRNEENNPMYQINLRLGFRPEPADLAFRKEVT